MDDHGRILQHLEQEGSDKLELYTMDIIQLDLLSLFRSSLSDDYHNIEILYNDLSTRDFQYMIFFIGNYSMITLILFATIMLWIVSIHEC
jgi:hypothetical protein